MKLCDVLQESPSSAADFKCDTLDLGRELSLRANSPGMMRRSRWLFLAAALNVWLPVLQGWKSLSDAMVFGTDLIDHGIFD
jgi:hypothetical protein